MDNSNYFGNRHEERLGVNKIGKNIRKSPPHQPYFGNPASQPPYATDLTNPARQHPYPQVYNVNKNDFRDTVQRLTGSPSHHQEPPPRPSQNSTNTASGIRLQRIRPPGLAPINVYRPQVSVLPPRPAVQYGQPPPQTMVPPPMTSGDHMGWANAVESPISAYMRYLQQSVLDSGQRPPSPLFPSPRMTGPPPPPPVLPSPRTNHPVNLPSPTSQFLLPSPSGYMNLLSPLSPYPLLSPGYNQHPPPLTPVFSFSPAAQSGMLGHRPPPPPSPGMGFPSPGFFQFSSPRWRD
ncbi:hypothetical protein L1887_02176 [Cichorium endivia]|nr:hypothetical protein L1887_02176 [Cichorium endivia]